MDSNFLRYGRGYRCPHITVDGFHCAEMVCHNYKSRCGKHRYGGNPDAQCRLYITDWKPGAVYPYNYSTKVDTPWVTSDAYANRVWNGRSLIDFFCIVLAFENSISLTSDNETIWANALVPAVSQQIQAT